MFRRQARKKKAARVTTLKLNISVTPPALPASAATEFEKALQQSVERMTKSKRT